MSGLRSLACAALWLAAEAVGGAASDDATRIAVPAAGAGPFAVQTVERVTLHDAARGKDLHVFVSYPKGAGPFPVIVFSHGAMGSGDNGFPIVRHWTSHGYIILCPTHADSIKLRREQGQAAGGAETISRIRDSGRGRSGWDDNWTQRPRDVSFVLDSLDEIERRVPDLRGRLDRNRIGVGGHSLGAYTAQVAAGASVLIPGRDGPQSFADPRIKAVLQLSGQGTGQQGLHKGSWKDIRIPMMCVTGSLDRAAQGQDPLWRREPYEYAPPGDKYFVFIQGAHHGSFTGKMAEGDGGPGGKGLAGWLENPSPEMRRRLEQRLGRKLSDDEIRRIGQRIIKGSEEHGTTAPIASGPYAEQTAIFGWVKQATTAFWEASLKGNAAAKAWLQSDALGKSSNGAARLDAK